MRPKLRSVAEPVSAGVGNSAPQLPSLLWCSPGRLPTCPVPPLCLRFHLSQG